MSELPKGWVSAKLGDYIHLKNGFAFKSKDYSEPSNMTVPVIRISDINGTVASDEKANHVPTELAVSEFGIAKGDLLVAMSGATTGKIGVYGGSTPAYQNQRVGNLKLNAPELSHVGFRNHLIKYLSPTILDIAYGGAQPNISASGIESIDVSFPPLAEQKRIVEKLDEVLAQVDTIKARLDGIPDLLKRFRQSVLASAVSGKLTQEWRGGVHTTENSCHTELSEFRGKALKSLPSNWIWVRFDSVNEVASNLVDPLDNPNDYHIAPNHIESKSGRLLDYTTVEEDKVKSSKHRFFSGQVLYSKIRPYLCKAVLVDFNGVCSADMYPLNTQMEPQYLLNWLLSDQFTEWASNGDSRTVLPKINKKQLSEIPCPLPPSEEQKEIVRLVDQYFAFADTIEAQVKKAQARVDNLTQSILAKAFRGELVAQDPNDEPADKLLERIAEARKEAEALAKAAKKAEAAKKKAAKSA